MQKLREILNEARAAKAARVPVYVDVLAEALHEHDELRGMQTAFRHAANSLAVEAGVIATRVPHDEAGSPVLGDVYFLQLMAEAELRHKSLSVKYEKLRAAAVPVLDRYANEVMATDVESDDPRILAGRRLLEAVR